MTLFVDFPHYEHFPFFPSFGLSISIKVNLSKLSTMMPGLKRRQTGWAKLLPILFKRPGF